MKKTAAILAIIASTLLSACSKDEPPRYVQQPAPMVIQQAPALEPAPQVIVQQAPAQDHSGTALVAGAALGAIAATALADRDRDTRYVDSRYDRPAVQQVNKTTVVNKTVIVNNPFTPTTPAVPAPEKQVAPVTAPPPTTAAKAVDIPTKVPDYRPANSVVPTMKMASVTPTPAPAAVPEVKKPTVLQMQKTPAGLQMSKTPLAAASPSVPTPPKKVDYGYKAPTTTTISPKITYGTTPAKK